MGATDKHSGPFSKIEDAIAAIRKGELVIVVDDEDRKNEGDLTIAAEKITADVTNSGKGSGDGREEPKATTRNYPRSSLRHSSLAGGGTSGYGFVCRAYRANQTHLFHV